MNRKVYTSIHPLVGVGVSGLKSLFLSLLFFGIHQASFGQCNLHVPVPLACNDNVQISLDDNGTALVLPDHILEGTYDLQFYSVSITAPSGAPVANPLTCANIGQTLNVKVTDICTNNYCTGTITVEDNLPPTLVCQDVVTHCAVTNFSPAYLSGVLGIANANPVAFDNCEIDLLAFSDTWFDLDCNQSVNGYNDLSAYIQRVWVANDPSGNQSTCTQYIYIERLHVYDVSFPANVTVSCENPATDPSSTGTPFYVNPDVPAQIFPLEPGTYCELNITYLDQILPVCDGTYQILRTWTVYDECLPTSPFPPNINPMYHVQAIQVLDDQGPTFACPDDITVGTNTTDCERDLNLPDVIVEDACSRIQSITAEYKVNGVTYTINGTLTNFPGNNLWTPDTLGVIGFANNLPLGSTDVKYIVTDDCGNSSVCSFEVTVEDQAPPAAICDEFTQVSLGINGMVLINATTFDDGSYDNCSPVAFKVRRMDSNSCQDVNKFHDQVKFCCSDIGDTVTVILRVYDVDVPAGDVDLGFEEDHSNECMVQVFVEDKLKPVCQAPANVTVSCENFDPSLWAYGTATAVDNCCVDTLSVFNILTNFDTTCNKGSITRRWTVEDCAGLTSTCTQRIVVNYEQDYFIRFPVDKLLFSCDSSFYQEPALLGEDCELLAISYHDEVFTVVPDACFKIERTWSIINWCTYNPNAPCIYVPNPNPNPNVNSQQNLMGPTVSAPGTTGLWTPSLMRINPTDLFPTDFSTFWDPNANCYEYKQIIKVSDNQDPVFANCPVSPVEVCDLTTNHNQLWNEMYWYDAATGSHDLCEAPTDLAITASDACSNQLKFRYLLFLDLDNSGDMETVINSINLPGYNTVPFGNAGNPNFSGGTPRSFDERTVPFNQKYGFAIQTVDNGGSVTASVKWNTIQSPNTYVVPEFPYGTHKIKWIAEDQCGNEKICEYTFVVKDCKAPTVVCINGLSVNIMPTQMISLWASDFLQHLEDNCTPTQQIKLGIRRKGAGTGFPTNPDGTPQTEVNFTCADLGTQFVELWGLDLAGNADYCETYLLVQDNQGFCNNDHVTVAGALKTEDQSALQDAEIELNGSHPALPTINMFDQSGNDGSFVFSNTIPVASDYTVTPSLDVDHLNGVSTYDLVLINKHILGIETFGSPYKIIAADANNSKSVTTFDIAELRKLILGIYTELPQNTSWRFVDAAYAFPTPDNPFAPAFPESKSTAAVQANQMGEDFVAVKIGDVNQSAIANSLVTTNDRTSRALLLDLEDQLVREGEEVVVNFTAAEKVLGYQFTLLLNGLEVREILPGTGMTMQHFGVFENAVTTSFDSDVQGEFTLVFRAVQSGSLRNMLGISGSITPSEAYDINGDKLEVALRFNGSDVQGIGFELYQNQPNPFVSKTVIGFYLPEAGEATLSVFDESGRLVYTQKGDFAKGHNNVSLDRSQVNGSGMLYYKLVSGENSASKKMIQIK
ncbi:MAG: T9SS type A sorting domain-containing protein [Saprospiraceae bacterium]|nr:T9SS type A sorting domain-containing protein [Saprospiraceae bacterium]